MRESSLVKGLTILSLLPFISTVSAETETFSNLKPGGVSVEWYQHELDMKVTGIETNVPGITDELVNAVKGQLKSTDNAELINLKLDYQLRPYLNVYGAVGKITGSSRVDFSGLGVGISDLVVDNKGTAYTAGAILAGQYGRLLPSLHFAHSQINLDGNSEDITINALIPAVGWQTDYGILSTSLVYQAIDAAYSGNVAAPIVGEVPVTVKTENNDDVQMMAGWATRLTEDLYLNANVGLNGQKQFQLQVNKRF